MYQPSHHNVPQGNNNQHLSTNANGPSPNDGGPPPNIANGNGHAHPEHQQSRNPQPNSHTSTPHSNRSAPQAASKDPITVVGIPSVSIQNNQLLVGNSSSSSTRSYTPLKVLGDGSFGTVWLCDWHGTLPPNTPLATMQCGGGAKPEWAGKRLVAVKRMKKRWEGGWDECKKLKELESLRAIPFHPNIIPLYDFFLLPASKELYFVFESMEGNLYHLIRARKGRAFAGGLVCSIFRQVAAGLHHIHASGYFHRDMKPENVLVTTTGLFDYKSVSPLAPPNAPPEKDVVAIIKLADFGLARETKSRPPYTEYVSTRWYRAPEVLLLSRDYSNPVDMWALGTIMAELVNLRPLFPGSGQVDQIARICEVLGDPSDEYGSDARGKSVGGGKWSRGIKMAKAVGFTFPKIQPRDFHALFDRSVPPKLIECIADLLKYDPDARLTSRQCLEHPYILETLPKNNVPMPTGLTVQTNMPPKLPNGLSATGGLPISSPRNVPPSHSHHSVSKAHHPSPHMLAPGQIPDAAASHRTPFYPTPNTSTESHSNSSNRTADYVNGLRIYDASMITEEQRSQAEASSVWGSEGQGSPRPPQGWDMEVSPQVEVPPGMDQPMDIQTSPMVQEHPTRLPGEDLRIANGADHPSQSHGKFGKLGAFGFPKKPSKWNIFGNSDKSHLPPVDEVPNLNASTSTPSLKRSQSSSTDSRSLSELSPVVPKPAAELRDPKMVKKEAERMRLEAEKQQRALREKMQRDQARAVMEKRNQLMMNNSTDIHEWANTTTGGLVGKRRDDQMKAKHAATGPIRQGTGKITSPTLGAAGGRFSSPDAPSPTDWRRDVERSAKARRRDMDDDHSMSSSDVHSVGPMSNISFASVDSDPGPARMHHRPSLLGMNRMQSTSSLRTSFDDFPQSVRSSNSLSFEQHLVNDFSSRAQVDPALSGSVSPPPMQALSLNNSPSWMQHSHHDSTGSGGSGRQKAPGYIPVPPPSLSSLSRGGPPSPFDFNAKSSINPMFRVQPLPSPVASQLPSREGALPPFSQLEAVAEGEYPPLSPMSFHTPDDDH